MNRPGLGCRAVLALLATLGLVAGGGGEGRAAELLVGGATTTITPDQPVALAGQMATRIARTVASVWRQEKLNEAAEEIAALGKELHSRLSTMAQHMEKVGKNLATANTAYNQMVGSFESQVFTQARRFEALGAGSAKELAEPPLVEAAPRPLTKLASPAAKPADNEDEAAA